MHRVPPRLIKMNPSSLVLVCSLWILGCWASGDTAVEIAPSEYFDGNDGPWSSFFVRVGVPEQDVRVLVSTASPETLVVSSDLGCSSQVFGNSIPSDCATSRGMLFNPNNSATWDDLGTFNINGNGVGLEANLGYSQPTDFASETLGISLTGPRLDNQTVGVIATASPFYLGIFGLNNQPVNFTSLGNYSSPSFLTTLKNQNTIPSLSWSYTAGARYRLKQVYGQLILSGYDTSRFQENSATFTMADDLTRDLVVVLQSISYSGTTSSTLLSDPINIFIDSTDPNLWLPESVCDAFEQAFGLTLDSESGLYLVNDTQHTQLQNADAEVTFRLSDVSEGGEAVTVTLPYGAFDLTAMPPLVGNESYYFPLKRAANETQYTLGRAFLQEAYLTADYERHTFNVSACVWNEGAKENIVTISSADGNSGSTPGSGGGGSSSLGGGAIAGIVIGAIAFFLIVGAIIFLVIRRQRKKSAYAASEPEPAMSVLNGPVYNAPLTPGPPKFYSPETVGDSTGVSNADSHRGSVAGQHSVNTNDAELDGESPQIHQLHGESATPQTTNEAAVYHELPGTEVRKTTSGRVVSAMEASPSLNREGSEDSPYVSTLGSLGWPGDRGDASSDLVSPTTPVHHRKRSSIASNMVD
ncbi:acid protease [Hypoxylon sp. FL1150]|nr:acid protease [Hypoxylon sp. FL1150]